MNDVELFREENQTVNEFLYNFEDYLSILYDDISSVEISLQYNEMLDESELLVVVEFTKVYSNEELNYKENKMYDELSRYDWFNHALPFVIIDMM